MMSRSSRRLSFTAGRCRPPAGSTTRIVAQPEDANNIAPVRSRRAGELSGHPRPSLGERYGSRAAYLDAVRSFARALVTARHVVVGLSCAKVGERERATLSVPPRALTRSRAGRAACAAGNRAEREGA